MSMTTSASTVHVWIENSFTHEAQGSILSSGSQGVSRDLRRRSKSATAWRDRRIRIEWKRSWMGIGANGKTRDKVNTTSVQYEGSRCWIIAVYNSPGSVASDMGDEHQA